MIELVLAFMFSSIILTVLFTSFFQLNRSSVVAEDIIDMDSRIYAIAHQLNRDLSGAFVPVQGLPIKEEKKDEQKKDEAAKKDDAAKKQDDPSIQFATQITQDERREKKETAATEPKKKEKKEKPAPIKNIFLSTNKGDILQELTFITNNPMQVYEYAKNTEVKPKIVRVMYRLVPDPNQKNSYNLMRQEGIDLESAQYKKDATKPVKAYELAQGIKSLAIKFIAPAPKTLRQAQDEREQKGPDSAKASSGRQDEREQKGPDSAKASPGKQDEREKKEKKKEEPIVFETKKEWRSDEIREKTPKTSQLPQFVEITITLWDNQFERDRTFTFNYTIASYGHDIPKPKPEQPKETDKTKKEAEEKKAQEAKKTANMRQQQRYISVAEMKKSVKDFVTMMNGKSI